MTLFTFVSETEGSTIVEQARGADILDAIHKWGPMSQVRPRLDADVDATPVTGVADVWCVSGLTDRDAFFLTHIIATSSLTAGNR